MLQYALELAKNFGVDPAKSDAVLRSTIPWGYTVIGDLANARKEIVRVEALKGSVSANELVTLLGFSEPSAVSRFLREHCRSLLQGSSPGSKSRQEKCE